MTHTIHARWSMPLSMDSIQIRLASSWAEIFQARFHSSWSTMSPVSKRFSVEWDSTTPVGMRFRSCYDLMDGTPIAKKFRLIYDIFTAPQTLASYSRVRASVGGQWL
ncbi:MAG: hypothetical protein HQL65_14590 [Magnetococcales bacterium]|nr:hypothetical protein [Magnetococcales bacterium]